MGGNPPICTAFESGILPKTPDFHSTEAMINSNISPGLFISMFIQSIFLHFVIQGLSWQTK
jgi:hypothetical protein